MHKISTFSDLMNAYTELYENQHNLQEAHAVIQREMGQFPMYKPWIIAWDFGILAEMGDQAGAVALLRTAIDEGGWYHEDVLRGSPDVASLQHIPEYQELVERSRQQRLQTVAATKPELKILEPTQGTPPHPLLIALHGNMGSIRHFESSWSSVPTWRWLTALPQSSQNTWVNDFYVWDDQTRALAEIKNHYDSISQSYPIDVQQVVLAGFSAGGEAALRAALTNTIKVQGFIGVEGWVFDLTALGELLSVHQNPDLRVVLVAGKSHQFGEDAQKVCEMLQQHGIRCTLETTPNTSHRIPDNFEAILQRALAFITAR